MKRPTIIATGALLLDLVSPAVAQTGEDNYALPGAEFCVNPGPCGTNLQEDSGDVVSGGQVVGDNTPDCERPGQVLASGLCDINPAGASASATAAADTAAASSASVSAPAGEQYATDTASSPTASASVLPAGEAEAVTILPDTGGASLLAVGAGVLLVVVGGLLAWRVIRS